MRRHPHNAAMEKRALLMLSTLLLFPLVGCDSSPELQRKQQQQQQQHQISNRVEQQQQQQQENVTRVRATLGRTASMKCTAAAAAAADEINRENNEKVMVSWVRHRDVSLLAVGKFVYISDDRFRVLHESDAPTDWFLLIRSVGYKDEGIYECQLNSARHKFILSVVEPRTEILGESELYVDHASSLNLTCLVISPDPPAYVFWKKDEQLIDISESSGIRSSSKQAKLSPSESLLLESHVKVVFAQNSPRAGVTLSSLVIGRVNGSHSGNFSCMPSNSEAKTIRVHVLKDDSQPAAIHTTTSSAHIHISFSSMLLLSLFFFLGLISVTSLS